MSSVGFQDCTPAGTPGTPGSRVTEIPAGAIDCDNLSFTTANEFFSGSLEVYNDGIRLYPVEFSEGLDLQSFTIILTPGSSEFISEPPESTEKLLVSYTKT